MKYLRRTDKKYQPLQRLLNPQVLANADYYRESNYSASFSKELDKTFEMDNPNLKKQRTHRSAQKKPVYSLKKLNRSLQ